MIEIAAVLSAVVPHWADFAIIVLLLLFNVVVGFWQEHQAANAVDALKKQLALKARARRDGKWREAEAAALVPGDILRLRLGDIIPADVLLIDGDYLSVDQSALTGESLPVNKAAKDTAYSGSVVKQGEMLAVVTATGGSTYFGKTARLVSEAKSVSHFQKAVLHIGDYLIYLSLGLAAVLLLAFAQAARDAGADRLRLADTVGVAHPLAAFRMVRDICEKVPGLPLEFHAHNDMGMATANAVNAADAGARAVDRPLVGDGVFTHESGIHLAGLEKTPWPSSPSTPWKPAWAPPCSPSAPTRARAAGAPCECRSGRIPGPGRAFLLVRLPSRS